MKQHAGGVIVIGVAVLLILVALPGHARAALIDFEDGTDRAVIASTIPGLEFTTTEGYDWIYGDWRTGAYNGPYPNGPDPYASQYYSNGNFFAWLGENQGRGVISFTWAYATYVSLGYSSESTLYLEAYDSNDNMLDSASGGSNLDTGTMNYLRVNAPGMAYIIVHDSGNYWLIDDLDTDAVVQCTQDAECDDGLYCTGTESCDQYHCVHNNDAPCPDDGLFCNGLEVCDEETKVCSVENVPQCDDAVYCNGVETCSEATKSCQAGTAPCADDGMFCDGQEVCDEETASCDVENVPQCDDGVYCNGVETCDNATQGCLPGIAVTCPDDGIYCNGTEICSEDAQGCDHTGDPCAGNETCDEATASCTPAPSGGGKELHVKSVGGCGCGA